MTDVQVMFHPEAIAEARAAYEWYGERDAAAAAAFDEEQRRGNQCPKQRIAFH